MLFCPKIPIRFRYVKIKSTFFRAALQPCPLRPQGLEQKIADQSRPGGTIDQQSGRAVLAAALDQNKARNGRQQSDQDKKEVSHGAFLAETLYQVRLFASFFLRSRMAFGVISTSSSSLI